MAKGGMLQVPSARSSFFSRSTCLPFRVGDGRYLADVGAHGHRTADRVDRVVADDQIEIRRIRTDGRIARRLDLRTALPPAVLAADYIGGKRSVQPRPRPGLAVGRLDPYPVAGTNVARCCGIGVDVKLGVCGTAAQAGQTAVLTLAIERILSAGQDKRIARHEPGLGTMAYERFLVMGQRRVAMLEQGFREELDPARRGVEAARCAVRGLRILSIARIERHVSTFGRLTQCLE